MGTPHAMWKGTTVMWLSLWGAIAWSPSTNRWGRSSDCLEFNDANAEALRLCGASDAQVMVRAEGKDVVWFLVAEDGSWATGSSGSLFSATAKAKRVAEQNLRSVTQTSVVIAVRTHGGVIASSW